MKPTSHEVAAIGAAARRTFGSNAVARLFGSRAGDAQRALDLDLQVGTSASFDFQRGTAEFLERVLARIDEQRIGVLVATKGTGPDPIGRIVYREGIAL